MADRLALPPKKRTKRRRQLSLKMKLFANAFFENGGNGTAAAIDSGYARSSADITAINLLKNEKVLELINNRKAIAVANQGITKEWVVEQTKDIFANSDKDKIRLQSLELLMKLLGFEAPKKAEININMLVQADREYIRKRLFENNE